MYAAIEQMKAGNTTADVAAKFPTYADDEYGTVTLQQFAHSIGLSLYEGMWISRAYSLDYPVELEENMYFASETFAGHPGLEQTVRLEENLLVTKDGPVIFTKHPFDEEALVLDAAGRRHRPRLRRPRDRAGDARAARRRARRGARDRRGDARRRSRETRTRSSSATRRCRARVVEAAAEGGCRVISRYGIGVDNVDVEAASEHGILVTNVPDYCLDEVADHTIALLLAAARGARATALGRSRDGGWSVPQASVHSLARAAAGAARRRADRRDGRRAGARRSACEVVGVRPVRHGTPVAGIELAHRSRRPSTEADFVSLHVPMTAETRHLVDEHADRRDEARAGRSSTPRAAVSSTSTRRCARSTTGGSSGLALDVTEPEPLPADHPLRSHPRVDRHAAHGLLLGRGPGTSCSGARPTRSCARFRGEPPRSPVNATARGGVLTPEPGRAIYPGPRGQGRPSSPAARRASARRPAGSSRRTASRSPSVARWRSRQPRRSRPSCARSAPRRSRCAADCTEPAEVERDARARPRTRLGPVELLVPFAGGFDSFTPSRRWRSRSGARVIDGEPDLDVRDRAGVPARA